MTGRTHPVLLLSEYVATTYAAELTAAAPGARIVRFRSDDRWEGDPREATAAYLSHELWLSPASREVFALLAELPALHWLHTASAGVDHPTFAALLARGVALTNAAGVNSVTLAQHILAFMLAHARRLHDYQALQSQCRWHQLACDDLSGATLLIVGLGAIGRETARLGRAFGMQVLATRHSAAPTPDVDEVHSPGALPELLPRADYVVLACPLTDATRGLIDARALAAMRPSAYLVNVARGPVVDTAALEAALRAGRIAGAALDVFDEEPLPPESSLWSTRNLRITPHSAGSSPHNRERNARFFLENLAHYVRGEPLANVVTRIE